MHWTSSLSTAPDANAAIDEVVGAVTSQLGGTPDLVFVFVSPHHLSAMPWLAGRLSKEFGHAPVVGNMAAGVIGSGHELEEGAALAVAAAHLPGVTVNPFFLEAAEVPPPGTPTAGWDARLGLGGGEAPNFVVMPDPFTTRPTDLVEALDGAYPDSTIVGGVTSGAAKAGDSRLLCGNEVHEGGVVGVALTGNITMDAVVAQGCRPVGSPMFVTRGSGNVIAELDGRPTAQTLQGLYDRLPNKQQQQLRDGLQLGLGMTAEREVYTHGDFLIRDVIGLDARTGSMAVGAPIKTGQVVQFHVRDAQTSADDLDALLAEACQSEDAPAGALLFSCLGRGKGLYGDGDHDSSVFAKHAPSSPVAGFFCGGEIGPVGGQTHVHGYTSVFAVFRRRNAN